MHSERHRGPRSNAATRHRWVHQRTQSSSPPDLALRPVWWPANNLHKWLVIPVDETAQATGLPVIAREPKQSRCWQRKRACREVASSRNVTPRNDIEIIGVPPEEECEKEMFVTIPWEVRWLAW